MKYTKRIVGIFLISILVFALSVIFIPTNVKAASITNPTKWEVVDSSLSDLLNDGWKLVNHSYSDARTSSSPGVTGVIERTYTYLLIKNDKYITCHLPNPFPGRRNVSGCRSIN
jgi:hypothetical protein